MNTEKIEIKELSLASAPKPSDDPAGCCCGVVCSGCGCGFICNINWFN